MVRTTNSESAKSVASNQEISAARNFLYGRAVAHLASYCIIEAQQEVSHDNRNQRTYPVLGEFRSSR
jgi:hypothetical protein